MKNFRSKHTAIYLVIALVASTSIVLATRLNSLKSPEQVAKRYFHCFEKKSAKCYFSVMHQADLNLIHHDSSNLKHFISSSDKLVGKFTRVGTVKFEEDMGGIIATQKFMTEQSVPFSVSTQVALFDEGFRCTDVISNIATVPFINIRDKDIPPYTGLRKIERLRDMALYFNETERDKGVPGLIIINENPPRLVSWIEQVRSFEKSLANSQK